MTAARQAFRASSWAGGDHCDHLPATHLLAATNLGGDRLEA